MCTGIVIRKNEYHDSVFLMRTAGRISAQEGIAQALLFMGTEKNKELLATLGFPAGELAPAGPTDLILAVRAQTRPRLAAVLENLDGWLRVEPGRGTVPAARDLDEALIRLPRANLAVISVPGMYAADEAQKALERSLNVFVFSDNVPVERERALKRYASDRGLIVMGPDCGTAIIGGIGIGFANAVRRGPVGVIGASGTGIQEFTTLVHRAGSGISQAIGTGSRDVSDAVGGISLLAALRALATDAATGTIAVVSKPPGPRTLEALLPRVLQSTKPVVLCFLGGTERPVSLTGPHRTAATLDEAAALAVRNATGNLPPDGEPSSAGLADRALGERKAMHPAQRYVRGLFAGGTFCYQAQQIFRDAGVAAYSNAPIAGNPGLTDPLQSREHSLIDLGADEFTAGRPHPMMDSRLRRERILAEAADPAVAVLLVDFLLGFNAAADPAGELAPAIAEAKGEAERHGRFLSVVASVCGTEEDPQGLDRQVACLEEAGVVVLPSSAQAARFAALLAVQAGGAG